MPGEALTQRTPIDWVPLLQDLDDERVSALVASDAEAVAEYTTPGPARTRDVALVGTLTESGQHPEPWATVIVSVSPMGAESAAASAGPAAAATSGRQQLRVHDRRGSYRSVGSDGQTATIPASPEREWIVTLMWSADRWRLADVSAGGGA
jgi:hypothetical protein